MYMSTKTNIQINIIVNYNKLMILVVSITNIIVVDNYIIITNY